MDQYECDNCGACRKTFPFFASATDAEREPRIRIEGQRLPENQSAAEWEYRLYPLPFLETFCFLDSDNLCTIYATRPESCRRFTPGGEQ